MLLNRLHGQLCLRGGGSVLLDLLHGQLRLRGRKIRKTSTILRNRTRVCLGGSGVPDSVSGSEATKSSEISSPILSDVLG